MVRYQHHPHHTYHTISVGEIPHHKQMKLLKTGVLHLADHELAGNQHILHLHPESHAKAVRAKHGRKGLRIRMTSHEIEHNAMHGGGIFSSIKDFFNRNGTKILDSLQAVGKVIAPELSPLIDVGRDVAKTITGKGRVRSHKSAEEIYRQRLANLAKARAAKQKKHPHGGSFLQAGY